jgi:hypothetical protein
MKKIVAWARRNPWDLAACLLFLLLAALILANLSMFPVFLDMPYHLAATRGFMESGGVVTWDWWEFAPAGRPHIYPPLLHVVMSIPLGLGLSEQAVGAFFSLIMFPLIMLSMWWMVRRLFGPRQAFYSSVLLLVPYAFFRQSAVTTAASLVLALTPLIFLGLERKRWVTPALLLAACLYTHLVLGHLVALALFIYLLHRREMWRGILKVLAAAYILYIPWGLNIALHLSSFSVSEAGGGAASVHLLIWMAALAALPLCYIRKGRHYILSSYFLSMIPIVFFYSNRFWDGHALLPLAMLGGLFLETLHDGLSRLFAALPDIGRRAGGMVAACVVGLLSLALLLVDPVMTWGGKAPAGAGPKNPPVMNPPATDYRPPGSSGEATGPAFPGARVPFMEGDSAESPYISQLYVDTYAAQPVIFADLEKRQASTPPPNRPQQPEKGNSPYEQGKERQGNVPAVPGRPTYAPTGPAISPGAVSKSKDINLDFRFTTMMELAVGDESGKNEGPGNGVMFSRENLELCRIIEENSDEGDVVFVGEARLADLVFAMTGRPVSSGMFREVSPEEATDPQDAAIVVVPNRGVAPGMPPGAPQDGLRAAPQQAAGELLATVGPYSVYLNQRAEAEVRPASPAFPLWAAYLVLALAGLLVALDRFLYLKGRGGGGDPEASGGPPPQGLSPGEEGAASFLVAVPCLNEEANIGRVVREVREAAPQARVLVVDDGSRDRTAEEAAGAGAVVVRNRRNLGVGRSLQRAFRLALSSGHAWMVRLDGDGQHDPSFLADLLRPLREGQADAVVGSRYAGMSRDPDLSTTSLRRGSRRLFALVVRLYTGRRFSDPNSGMWAFNRRAMRFLAEIDLMDYPEGDMLIQLQKAGFRVAEVPVRMRPRRAGRSSIRPVKALLHLARLLLHPVFDPPGRPAEPASGTAAAGA